MNNVENLYQNLYELAKKHGLEETMIALPYAQEKHEGMFRKGEKNEPYIIHPITMANHAIALGWIEDDLIATALLHDVCEDCGVAVEELPVNANVKHSVALLTKKPDFQKAIDNEPYYAAIEKDRIASIVKILDRCHNISCMSYGFPVKKVKKYALETMTYVYPLLRSTKRRFPDTASQMFALEYHMRSVIHTACDMMAYLEK